ncbi:MAG: hypothetical protein QG632_129 [Candidatus Dependentiae bacterium]|nr:hypothetical protein [Candidatus Dependentiae bacterium]
MQSKKCLLKASLVFALDFLSEYIILTTSLLLSFFHRARFLVRWICYFDIIVIIGTAGFCSKNLKCAPAYSPLSYQSDFVTLVSCL